MLKTIDFLLLGSRPGDSLEASFKMAEKYGYDGLEVMPGDVLAEGIEHVKAMIEKYQVCIPSFGLCFKPTELPQEKYEEKLKELAVEAKAMAEVGSRVCFAFVRSGSDEYEYEENYKFHAQRWKPVAEVLDKYHIKLALEFIGPKTSMETKKYPFIRTAEELLPLCREIGDNCGLLFDFWHWYSGSNDRDVFEHIDGTKYVYHVHVNDAMEGDPEKLQDKPRRLVGESGVIDTKFLVDSLKKYGYQGALVSESFDPALSAMGSIDEKVAAVKAAMDRVFGKEGDGL